MHNIYVYINVHIHTNIFTCKYIYKRTYTNRYLYLYVYIILTHAHAFRNSEPCALQISTSARSAQWLLHDSPNAETASSEPVRVAVARGMSAKHVSPSGSISQMSAYCKIHSVQSPQSRFWRIFTCERERDTKMGAAVKVETHGFERFTRAQTRCHICTHTCPVCCSVLQCVENTSCALRMPRHAALCACACLK